MERLYRVQVKVGDLRDSEFREFLGPVSDEDVLALKEDSYDRYNDFWMGIRAYEKDGNLHLLFGHRRIRALVLKDGADKPVPVAVVSVTDEEKIQLLGEAGWKNSTDDERLGLVKLAAAFLVEHGEGNKNPMDIDLLKERVHLHFQNVGAKRISDWLGKRLWPRDRIWKLIDAAKPREVLAEGVELLEGEKHEPLQMPVPVVNENQVGRIDLPDDPTAPINPASTPVCKGETERGGNVVTPTQAAICQIIDDNLGSLPDRPPKKPAGRADTVYDESFVNDRVNAIERMIQADINRKLKSSDLVRLYFSRLRGVIDGILTPRIGD